MDRTGFGRLAAGRRVVNPGSVGMPYGPPGAHWALLGPGIWLRRTCYDTAAAAEVITASGYPDGAEWAREYVLHHAELTGRLCLQGFTGHAEGTCELVARRDP